jgi:hypothetical protein
MSLYQEVEIDEIDQEEETIEEGTEEEENVEKVKQDKICRIIFRQICKIVTLMILTSIFLILFYWFGRLTFTNFLSNNRECDIFLCTILGFATTWLVLTFLATVLFMVGLVIWWMITIYRSLRANVVDTNTPEISISTVSTV